MFLIVFHNKQRPGYAFPFNFMEMGKGLKGRKILLPETLDVLLKTCLKERISVTITKTFDKMLLNNSSLRENVGNI